MKRQLSERGKAYRKFLLTPFWRALSAEKKRLVPECEDCGETEKLQAHHTEYPEKWEETTLEQLKVLCRRCHRIEHGLRVLSPYDYAYRGIDRRMAMAEKLEDVPSIREILDLAPLVDTDEYWRGWELKEIQALLRSRASTIIILRSSRAWERWIKNREQHHKLWNWAYLRLEQFKKEVDCVR